MQIDNVRDSAYCDGFGWVDGQLHGAAMGAGGKGCGERAGLTVSFGGGAAGCEDCDSWAGRSSSFAFIIRLRTSIWVGWDIRRVKEHSCEKKIHRRDKYE